MDIVYNDNDLEKECICECCERDESVILAIIKKDKVTVLSHLCKECADLCEDLFNDIVTVRKHILPK